MVAAREEGTCVLSDRKANLRQMIRFVVDPDGRMMADLKAELPGPDLWTAVSGAAMFAAIEDGRMQNGAKSAFGTVPSGLGQAREFVARLEALLVQSCLNRLGLMRAAGQIITGFEKAGGAIASGRVCCLLEAADAREGGAKKIRGLVLAAQRNGFSAEMVIVDLFDRNALSQAMGLDNVVHGVITNRRVATAFIDEALRLATFRGKALPVLGKLPDTNDECRPKAAIEEG
jgi:uncharacterized protein